MPDQQRDCSIYRSERRTDTYLYVRADFDLDDLPPSIGGLLKPLTHVMDLTLTPRRSLARADAATVITQLDEQGFYIQLPPGEPDTTRH